MLIDLRVWQLSARWSTAEGFASRPSQTAFRINSTLLICAWISLLARKLVNGLTKITMHIFRDCLQPRNLRVTQSQRDHGFGGIVSRENEAGNSLVSTPIVKEIYIEASPRTVLEFLMEEDKLGRWITDSVLRATVASRRKLRVRFKRKRIERASVTIVVNGERAGAFLSRDSILGESSWAQSSLIEIELRPEGSGTALKLTHAHVEKS